MSSLERFFLIFCKEMQYYYRIQPCTNLKRYFKLSLQHSSFSWCFDVVDLFIWYWRFTKTTWKKIQKCTFIENPRKPLEKSTKMYLYWRSTKTSWKKFKMHIPLLKIHENHMEKITKMYLYWRSMKTTWKTTKMYLHWN